MFLMRCLLPVTQSAPVTLGPRWIPAAVFLVTATADLTTAASPVTSVPPVSMVTPAARVRVRSD